ncbi:hypothetical protein LVJ94_14425 [Pendulispora rubella]|uniref:Uncharacterized protein n=1 Tax=Pendulispora rubella TaxID=2741070 RepID=A0ABZ2LEW7_9BACT
MKMTWIVTSPRWAFLVLLTAMLSIGCRKPSPTLASSTSASSQKEATAAASSSVAPKTTVNADLIHAAASPARWRFAEHQWYPVARLEVDARHTLYVGEKEPESGRRTLDEHLPGRGVSDVLLDAEVLIPKALVGVIRDTRGRFVFVADDGEVYVSQDPLGPPEVIRPGPLAGTTNAKLLAVATGRHALLGITPQGTLVRSLDYGAKWRPVAYDGSKERWGKAVSVGLDEQGNGLLLLTDHVYVTHDDGATWLAIATPRTDAKHVSRDGSGRVFLADDNPVAFLDGNSLRETDFLLEDDPFRNVGPEFEEDRRRNYDLSESARTVLTGDRIIEFAADTDDNHVTVDSFVLGTTTAAPVIKPELAGSVRYDGSHPMAAYEQNLIYLRPRETGTGNWTTDILRSSDYGSTWRVDGARSGEPRHGLELNVALGPKGWTYVAPLDSRDTSDSAATPEFTQFVFDKAHGRVYALGSEAGEAGIYESELTATHFTRTKLLAGAIRASATLTVDPSGMLRLLSEEYVNDRQQWALRRRDANGTILPILYILLPSGQASLTGYRGLLLGNHGWETADGGETWVRVGGNSWGLGDIQCTAAGCLLVGGLQDQNGGRWIAQRLGWDLPSIRGSEVVRASTRPFRAEHNRKREMADER